MDKTLTSRPSQPLSSSPLCYVLDSELSILRTISSRVAAKGMRVATCPSLNSLLSRVAEESPNLVFLDVAFHETDAVEVMRLLGTTGFRGRVHLMGRRSEELMRSLIEIGVERGLSMGPSLIKPFRRNDIDTLLGEFLAGTNSLPPVRRERSTRHCSIGSNETLQDALDNHLATVFYRPRFDLETRRPYGAQVLSVHAITGECLISRYEQSAPAAVMDQLSTYTFETALRGWRTYSTRSFNPVMSVRIPLSSLSRLPIGRIIRDNRPESADWPGVVVDITEWELTQQPQKVQEIAAQLKIHGIQTSIGDFGTGGIALGHLGRFHPDEIAINRCFVEDCSKDRLQARLCESIIFLAKSLGARVVGEGVENLDDLQTLLRMGCNIAHGEALSPPLSSGAFEAFIARNQILSVESPKAVSGLEHLRETDRLSQREIEVLELIASGKSSKQAGLELGLSPRTIDVYRTRLMAKLNARNAAELVKLALTSR